MTDTITLTRTAVAEAEELHRMQVCAFAPLLKKYKDTDTNPAAETLEAPCNLGYLLDPAGCCEDRFLPCFAT